MTETKAKVREFLGRYLPDQEIADDEDMFSRGYANSMFVVQLVLFVEQELATPVDDDDLDFDNFRSVDAIAGFVHAKAGRPQHA
ncbi:acyl carrier protein [Saccharopolyspora gloriosae]|uniref:acyl carrier protein n=1 Tax=Saccharopolyspora gloriosae TaxID=455344 RepID=UPI001FB82C44|nr:phosphopantetheine-binding protein [Saccharopolyspora gloriosae]